MFDIKIFVFLSEENFFILIYSIEIVIKLVGTILAHLTKSLFCSSSRAFIEVRIYWSIYMQNGYVFELIMIG